MAAMNRVLQVVKIREALERRGIAADTVDVDALVDGTLTLPENLGIVEDHIGKGLYAGADEAYWEKQEYAFGEHMAEHPEASFYGPGADYGPELDKREKEPPVTVTPTPTKEPGPVPAADGPDAKPPEPAPPAKPPAKGPTFTPDPSRVREAVLRFVSDPDVLESLKRAVAHEDAAQGFARDFGWSASEVPVPPHHVKKLREAALVRVSYESNKYTQYLLVDREAVRGALLEAAKPPEDRMAQVSGERVKAFEEIAAAADPLEELVEYVAPHIHGLERAKKALLLSLVSADDEGVSRGRIHVMFHGPPGTAKTELLLWAAHVAGTEVFSPRMTGPGLTVDMRTGEPGALPRAHNSEFRVLAVDEVEKVPVNAVRQTLMALEEGQFTYVSANGVGTLKAEVRFMGAANEIKDLPPEFLDRQDFLVEIPLPTREAAKGVLARITDQWMNPAAQKDGDFIRDYIRWARRQKPRFPATERAIAARLLAMLIDLQSGDAIRVRPFESVLRVAYALARLRRSDVTAERVMDAIRVLDPNLNGGKLEALRNLVKHVRRGGE